MNKGLDLLLACEHAWDVVMLIESIRLRAANAAKESINDQGSAKLSTRQKGESVVLPSIHYRKASCLALTQ